MCNTTGDSVYYSWRTGGIVLFVHMIAQLQHTEGEEFKDDIDSINFVL